MYAVYIIQSFSTGRYYIGMSEDVDKRLREHNSGSTRSTRNKGPWKLVYREDGMDKRSAWMRERQIKKYKGGEAFKRLIDRFGGVA